MNKKLVLFYFIILLLFLFLVKNCDGYELINDEIKIERYVKRHNGLLTDEQRALIAKTIIKESSFYNISFKIVLAIIKIESNFDPYAISNVGAKGLTQVYTRMCFGIKADENRLFEIQYNIAFGLCILNNKLIIANNDMVKAIELYNGSGPEARKYVLKILDTLNKINKEFD